MQPVLPEAGELRQHADHFIALAGGHAPMGWHVLTWPATHPTELLVRAPSNVRFCRYRFPATDLNSKATWFGIQ